MKTGRRPIIAKPPASAQRWQGLAPQVAADAWALVLGSFPGRASLAASQYYGHPQNQFWRLLGTALELPLAGHPYEERLALLKDGGVGLWDVITSTEREGSLDSAIRNHQASDLHSLLDSLPGLRVIAFNGGTAARIGRRQLGERAAAFRLLELPSSSPAYTLSFDAKLAQWMQLRESQEAN